MSSLGIFFQKSLTVFAGFLANVKLPIIKNYLIKDFIRRYDVNMQEAQIEDPTAYTSFNNFFIRHLKTQCRVLDDADIVSPVDGCISEYGSIVNDRMLQAKGRTYSVHELLSGDENISEKFYGGSFITLYLSPKDYHRVHMPMAGKLLNMIHVPGSLFSVKPSTVLKVPRLFARNERLVVLFETSNDLMAMVLVGATIVGAIGTSWTKDLPRSRKRKQYFAEVTLKQAEEMGYFKLGSTVILLFEKNSGLKWNEKLKVGDKIRFGESLGDFNAEPANE